MTDRSDQPSTAPPSEQFPVPGRRSRTWSVRFGLIVLAAMVLAWAWQSAGMGGSTKLWTQRDRAVDYIFGQRVDATSIEVRRDEIERAIRLSIQQDVRAELVAEFAERGEPTPSSMELLRLAAPRTQERIDQLGPEQLAVMIDQRLADEALTPGRRGGYFPPETDPRKVFGDPEDLPRLHPAVSWIVELADNAGGFVRNATRWTFVAVTGEGYTGVLFETIAIAVWGTLLAVILAVPASLFGASLTLEILAPGDSRGHRVIRWLGKFVFRRSYDVTRGFNEIVLAMIFVAILGLGPLAGVLALFIHTYGVLAKVFADAIATIDRKQIEGIQSTGAEPVQVIAYSVIPQILPYIVSQSLLRFESNVRGATILGVVGAGGIGQLLMDKFQAFQFQEVATMMIIIIVVVTLIDFGCGRVMRMVA